MTVETVNKAISLLEAIDPLEESAYAQAILAYRTINKLPFFIYTLPLGPAVFKSRTHKENILFPTINEVSTPPKEKVKAFGRGNIPFQPKLYSSENRITSFAENIEYWADETKFGDKIYVTIGRWILKKPLPSLIISSPDQAARLSDFDKEHGQSLDYFINQFSGEFKEAVIIFYRFLFEKFRKPAKKDIKTYIITSAYCNLALAKSEEKCSCIYYPSVPYQGEGVNFCISPSFIKYDNIELTHVIRNEFVVYENEIGKHGFRETELVEAKEINYLENKIIWR
jgi:hypothetical protein